MSYLKSLLTLERSLKYGKNLETPPFRRRTFKEFLQREKIDGDLYKSHQTKAGLYTILPHTNEGFIFVSPKRESGITKRVRSDKVVLPNNFFLQSIVEEIGWSGDALITTALTKSCAQYSDDEQKPDAFEKERQIDFRLEYTINEGQSTHTHCEIKTLFLEYECFNNQHQYPHTSMSFTVTRSGQDSVCSFARARKEQRYTFSEKGDIKTYKEIPPSFYNAIDYEHSLQNLIEIMVKIRLTDEDFTSLENFSYLCAAARALH